MAPVPPFGTGTVSAAASWLALLIELTAIEEAMTVLSSEPASTLAAATLAALTEPRLRCEPSPKKAEAVTEDVASRPPLAVMVWLEVKVLAWVW